MIHDNNYSLFSIFICDLLAPEICRTNRCGFKSTCYNPRNIVMVYIYFIDVGALVSNRSIKFSHRIIQWKHHCFQSIGVRSPGDSGQAPNNLFSIFIFCAILSRCVLYVSVLSRATPKYLRQKLCFILLPKNKTLSRFLACLLFKWKVHTSVLLGFRHSFNVWQYWFRICKP